MPVGPTLPGTSRDEGVQAMLGGTVAVVGGLRGAASSLLLES